jgi:hypothetical protein
MTTVPWGATGEGDVDEKPSFPLWLGALVCLAISRARNSVLLIRWDRR